MRKNSTACVNGEDLRTDLPQPEKIPESSWCTELVGELIRVRKEQGISQKKLEELSGVKQPIIARMEKGYTTPRLSTVLKVLAPLGKTLAIVPLETKEEDA